MVVVLLLPMRSPPLLPICCSAATLPASAPLAAGCVVRKDLLRGAPRADRDGWCSEPRGEPSPALSSGTTTGATRVEPPMTRMRRPGDRVSCSCCCWEVVGNSACCCDVDIDGDDAAPTPPPPWADVQPCGVNGPC